MAFGSFAKTAAYADLHRRKRIQDEAARLKQIAEARYWLFHSTAAVIDIRSVLVVMGSVLNRLQSIQDVAQPLTASDELAAGWHWVDEFDGLVGDMDTSTGMMQLRISLAISGTGMSIPMTSEQRLVGRTSLIEGICKSLCEPGAKLLVHGLQGVGKDVIAAEVVLRDEIKALPGCTLQYWLQGSTDQQLRRQLVQLFSTHEADVIQGAADEEARIEQIKEWLKANDSWLFVIEDATNSCKAIAEISRRPAQAGCSSPASSPHFRT